MSERPGITVEGPETTAGSAGIAADSTPHPSSPLPGGPAATAENGGFRRRTVARARPGVAA